MKNTINGLADRTNRFGMRYVKRLIINEKGVYKDKFKENVFVKKQKQKEGHFV